MGEFVAWTIVALVARFIWIVLVGAWRVGGEEADARRYLAQQYRGD